jgi:CheY-like chemotaxis protein
MEKLQTSPVKLLLVEDDEGGAKSVQRALKSARILNPIIRAIDGVDALDILKGRNGKQKLSPPYILLVDISMPRMNGIELIEALRQDPDLRTSIVFILTTSKRDEEMLSAYNLNVAGYIVKERVAEDFQNLAVLIQGYWRIVELP